MDSLNLNSLSVNSDGRVTFSGLNSGIDFQAAVDAIIAAKRIPADRISSEIETNTDRIAALRELDALLSTLKDSLKNLFGAVSVGNSQNIFEAKAAFASTSRTDGQAPAAAADLIGVTVTNAAALGKHTLEVMRVAKAHKVSSDAFADPSAALGYAGTFTINGQSITASATDSLQDLRDRINTANSGANATGVTASIVNAGTGQNFLVLTADKTGTSMTLADTAGTVLDSLGVLTGGGIKNELQAAETARFKADGLIDQDRFESDLIGSATTLLNSVATSAAYPGSFNVTGATGTRTINYTATDTLTSLRDKINLETANTGVTASIVTEGSGVRLVLTEGSNAAITLGDTNGLLAGLGVDNGLVIERAENTVSDLFDGITLSLFQAQEGTTVSIDVDRDLSQVRSQVTGFVDAFNSVKAFLNQQQLVDETTGEVTDDTGILFGNRTVSQIQSELSNILGAGAAGTNTAFSVLAQIGIDFVDNATVIDPLLKDTLTIDSGKLDGALLNNPEDVRRLFAFDFSSSDPRVTMLGFTGETTFNAAGYTLNIGSVVASSNESKAVTSKTAEVSDAVNSVGATTSGTFDVNGTTITYDADGAGGNDDTLETIANKINAENIAGVTAAVVDTGSGTFKLQISSSLGALTVNNDTGDLLANLNLQVTGHTVETANINGVGAGTNDGSVTINGNVITATDATGAAGLTFIYTGDTSVSGISLNYTVGIGAQLYHSVDDLLTPNTGSLESEISTLQTQSDTKQARLDRILERLAFERDQLLERFIRMETNLATLNQTRDFITQFTDAQNAQSN